MKENILDIIKLRPISLLEIIKNNDIDKEIDTELILYIIILMVVSFYTLSTEKRFEEEQYFLCNPTISSEISDS